MPVQKEYHIELPKYARYCYIALLRGINVGGHSIIKMADLKKIFASFGLEEVKTYIQSGNVLFCSSEAAAGRLADDLGEKLSTELGYRVVVFVLTRRQLQEAAAHNPFLPELHDKEWRSHIMFLSDKPGPERIEALMRLQGEEYQFHLSDTLLYYAYSRKYDGKRRTIDFERVLGVTGTSRTWKVVDRLIELAGRENKDS
jgi:uncharacterized protein (DUF1697 family)